MPRCVAPALLFLLATALPGAAAAETVKHRIRLTLLGVGGPANHEGCPAKPGKEVIEGTVSADEASLAQRKEVEYTGKLERKTETVFCDLEGQEDQTDYCVTRLTGGSKVDLSLRIYDDRPGAYIQWKAVGKVRVKAEGDCDPDITDYIRTAYSTEEDFAEIPAVPAGRLVEGGRYVESGGNSSATLEVLEPKKLRAVPGGPYRVVRGSEVVLDGSASEGQITDSTWTLVAHDCPADPLPVLLDGVRVKLRPLCPVTATLRVEDGSDQDQASTEVSIVPRAWKTAVNDPTPTGFLTGSNVVKPCGCNFGRNLCEVEFSAGAMESFHYLHHDAVSTEYEHTAYELGRHADPSGLFDQWWWVAENLLQMKRVELLNLDLVAGGILSTENKRSGPNLPSRKADLDAIIACTRKHEAVHTDLLLEVLRAGDPAPTIEAMMQAPSPASEPLHTDVNNELGRVEAKLVDADDESAVEAELLGVSVCRRAATVRLRLASSAPSSPTYDDVSIPCLATKSDKSAGAGGGACPPP